MADAVPGTRIQPAGRPLDGLAEGSPAGASRAGESEFNRRTAVYSDARGREHRSDAAMRGYNFSKNALIEPY